MVSLPVDLSQFQLNGFSHANCFVGQRCVFLRLVPISSREYGVYPNAGPSLTIVRPSFLASRHPTRSASPTKFLFNSTVRDIDLHQGDRATWGRPPTLAS